MMDKIYKYIILIIFISIHLTAYAQDNTESRVGLNYGFEIFQYSPGSNDTDPNNQNLVVDNTPLLLPVFDLFYHTYNRNILVGGSAGIRWGNMDDNFKAYQLNLDVLIGLGTRYFDLYVGLRGRVWYELKQKSFQITRSHNELRVSNSVHYNTVSGNQILFSYAPLVGLRGYLMHAFNFTIEVTHNIFTDKTIEWDDRNYVFPFPSIEFSPIGIKVSIGLNIPDWARHQR